MGGMSAAETAAVAPERFPIKLPPGFDPNSHLAGLTAKVNEMYPNAVYSIANINMDDLTATAVRERNVSEVRHDSKTDAHVVDLVKGTKPSDGEAVAEKYETQYPGYTLTDFRPHSLRARLTRLTPEERHARDAISVALGSKPWDVKIRSTRGGGFDLILPRTYVPSKHDQKLDEVVRTAIGDEGWRIETDPKQYLGRVLPGDPPTFDPVYPFDFDAVPHAHEFSPKELFRIPLGMGLAPRGEKNKPVLMDLSDAVGDLLVGLAGGGKSVTTQSIIFSALARGWELALINTVDKATDFAWAKPYVREHMWGCDSVAQAVAVAKLVGEEGERRGELLSTYGVSKWQDLPANVRADYPPLLLVADELAALLTADPLPAGLPKEVKELPEFVKMQQDLLESKLLATALSKLPAVYRAAGIRVIYLTQQPNERYGFSTKLKGNLPHRVMLGVNPSQAEKGHAFRTPEKIPDVPRNIAQDPALARGVGLAHMDGQEPVVMKGYFAPLDAYIREAERRGFPKTSRPAPSAAQIERLVPRIGEGMPEEEEGFGHQPHKLEDWEMDPETGKPLDARQRANAAKHRLTVDAKTA